MRASKLLARRILGEVPEFFRVERFKVNVERRYNAIGELVTFSEATVKVLIGGETLIFGGGRRWSGQCARQGAAQGSWRIPALHRRCPPDRFSRAHLPGRIGTR